MLCAKPADSPPLLISCVQSACLCAAGLRQRGCWGRCKPTFRVSACDTAALRPFILQLLVLHLLLDDLRHKLRMSAQWKTFYQNSHYR